MRSPVARPVKRQFTGRDCPQAADTPSYLRQGAHRGQLWRQKGIDGKGEGRKSVQGEGREKGKSWTMDTDDQPIASIHF